MSTHETIGVATKLETAEPMQASEGVAFEIPYGKERYGIALSDADMDQLLDRAYETEVIGRKAVIGSGFVIELERPDLPLFALPHSIHIEKEPGYSPSVNLGVGIVTQSHAYEHRGILLAGRHYDGSWERARYEIQPPLKEPEEVFGPEAHVL